MSHALFAALPRKALLLLAALLLLFSGLGGALLVEAQTVAYVLMGTRRPTMSEGGRASFIDVDRLLIGMSHTSGMNFTVCFTGSATPRTDYNVYQSFTMNSVTWNGNCFTDTWGSGGWLQGAKRRYSIRGVSDNVSDPNETIIATVSGVNGAYTIVIPSVKITIRGG